MITKYGIYSESFEPLKMELRQKLEDELSKYFEMKTINDLPGYISFGQKIKDINIFLLDDKYGVRVKSVNRKADTVSATINTVYKNKNKFSDAGYPATYVVNSGISIEEFIEKYVKKLITTNEIRKKNNEFREFNRSVNKYNL